MTAEQKQSLAEVVAIDPEVMHGTPCFTGTRVPVQTLIDFLETGESIDEFLAVYPYIPRQQILSFLELSRDITIDQITCASVLDACVDPRVIEAFPGHEVITAFELRWHRLKE